MRTETLAMLCNPYVGEPFKREGETLVGVASGQVFPIRAGIPVIFDPVSRSPRNRLYRWLYDRVAFAYDPVVSLGTRLKVGTEEVIRQQEIAKLQIKPGNKVLETAIGTASNLQFLPEHGEYYGQDISWQMLRRAQKKLKRWGREAELFQGDGAYLPFRDSTFDVVFQMGGLQFYADPFRGVSEMARVAAPGSTITIMDEAGGAIRTLKRLPAHANYASDKVTAAGAMVRLVPQSMEDVKSEMLQSGEFYKLTFSKPGYTN